MNDAADGSRGPHGEVAVITISFDNLGEAAEVQSGAEARPPGSVHPSVSSGLPSSLRLLERHRLRATFFIEAVNCEEHPEALAEIGRRGHEIGCHGWRHEPWSALDPGEERRILSRSLTALRDFGLAPSGFRPPGGVLGEGTAALLTELGLRYCSPAGSAAGCRGALAFLPFEWPAVDAYFYAPELGPLRARDGNGHGALTPQRFLASAESRLDQLAGRGGHLCLVFHPFLVVGDQRVTVVDAILRRVAAMRDEGLVWVAAGDEASERMLISGANLTPVLDAATWGSQDPT